MALPGSQLRTQIPSLTWKFIHVHPSCSSWMPGLPRNPPQTAEGTPSAPRLKELFLKTFLSVPGVCLWQWYRTGDRCAPEVIPASPSGTAASKILVYCLSTKEKSGASETRVQTADERCHLWWRRPAVLMSVVAGCYWPQEPSVTVPGCHL